MKLRTHQFGGNFEEIEEREINKMAKRSKALNISVPQWMKDFMKENNMSPSRIVQDAVLAEHKRQLDEKWLRDLVELQKEHKFTFTKG